MIAPLRRRHHRMMLALAIAVPLLLVAALSARPPAAVTPTLPTELADTGPRPNGDPDQVLTDAFTRQDLVVRTWRQSDGAIVSLEPASPLTAPDLLLYVSAETTDAGAALPSGAVLLGPVPGAGERAYVLPPGTQGGSLVLYSLAWGTVVDAASGLTQGGGAAGGGR